MLCWKFRGIAHKWDVQHVQPICWQLLGIDRKCVHFVCNPGCHFHAVCCAVIRFFLHMCIDASDRNLYILHFHVCMHLPMRCWNCCISICTSILQLYSVRVRSRLQFACCSTNISLQFNLALFFYVVPLDSGANQAGGVRTNLSIDSQPAQTNTQRIDTHSLLAGRVCRR